MLVKIYFRGQLLLKGSTDHFGHVDLFVNLTMLNIIAVYSLSLSIIKFIKMTKNCKIFLKLPIKGQQRNNGLPEWSENFSADRSSPNEQLYVVKFALTASVSET